MMSYLKEWLKTILYMNVLLLICDSLIRKTRYEKYLRFFSGFLMMLCLAKPLIDLADAGDYMDAAYIRTELKNELNLVGNNDDFKDIKKEIHKEYETAIEKQICDLAKSFLIDITDIHIRWNTQGDSMKKLDLKGRKMEEKEGLVQINSFRETLIQFYNLEDSNINIEMQE